MISPVLSTHDVTKVFTMGQREVPILSGITFDILPGEFITIMGPSGCGKSTLLHLISGLDHPSSGEILLDGEPITRLNRRNMTLLRRAKIGFIFQFFNLLPHLTVQENISMPLLISGERPSSRAQYLDDLIRWVGVEHRTAHFPTQLSGGEMQRVSIARALANEPAIVLADEPTGNVSTSVGEEIMQLLRECAEKRNQAILLVTHNPKDAAQGDKVFFLKDGIIAHDHTLMGSEVNETRIFTSLQELGV